jgi:hypothetical protein
MMNPILVATLAIFWLSVFFGVVWVRRILSAPEWNLEDWFGWLERGGRKKREVEGLGSRQEVAVSDAGLEVVERRANGSVKLAWEEVCAVTAFKRGRCLHDQVCIRFDLADGSSVEADEEMTGWNSLCDKLPERFPGAPPWEEWFVQLAGPTLESCATSLYRRA